MATVETWFDAWLAIHLTNHDRMDWPDTTNEHGLVTWAAMTANWKRILVRNGASLEVATEASSRMTEENPFPSDHAKWLAKSLKEIHKENPSAGGHQSTDLAAVREASRGCIDCAGAGYAIRYRHHCPDCGLSWLELREIEVHNIQIARHADRRHHLCAGRFRIGVGFCFVCTCRLGDYIAATIARKEEESQRIPRVTVAILLELRAVSWSTTADNRYRYAPQEWDWQADRPLPPSTAYFRSHDEILANIANPSFMAPASSVMATKTPRQVAFIPDQTKTNHGHAKPLGREAPEPISGEWDAPF